MFININIYLHDRFYLILIFIDFMIELDFL